MTMTDAGSARAASRFALLIAGVLAGLLAGCSQPVPPTSVPAPTSSPTSIALAPSPSPSTVPATDGARLSVRFAGTIHCAVFPYGCFAAISSLQPGAVVSADWRPPLSDPRWGPDFGSEGASPGHVDLTPLGTVPNLAIGPHRLVLSLLGSYDTPSFAADGTVATDLLARCVGDVDVMATTRTVAVVITFTPDPETFGGTCRLAVAPDG